MYEEISTHTPVRVWQLNHVIRNAGKDFNSHTREGVTSIPQRYATWVANFNSHTREGVTLRGALRLTCWIISTHTPVRVWHALTGKTGATFVISTHTPVRVWRISVLSAVWLCKFQLTHPWGCDPPFSAAASLQDNFNSHTREGVTAWEENSALVADFNSHTREGVTVKGADSDAHKIFQLTHPWGCDSSRKKNL